MNVEGKRALANPEGVCAAIDTDRVIPTSTFHADEHAEWLRVVGQGQVDRDPAAIPFHWDGERILAGEDCERLRWPCQRHI